MSLNLGKFFQACNPRYTLNMANPDDRKYYIDFAPVRGSNVIRELKRTIAFSLAEPTCQLFTGHIGCGKSTELSRLKTELEAEKFHVVYFESSQDLDMADVDISDILLAIARQVSQSLEAGGISLQPQRFQTILQGAANLLNADITAFRGNIPFVGDVGVRKDSESFSLAFGIGEITAKAKDSKDVRALLRQHLEPRVNNIIEAINQEVIEPAQQQLKEKGQSGLVVIVDNLDRIDNKPKFGDRTQPEYIFVERGEQLNKLRCHVVYTIPLGLIFSSDLGRLTNRFGSDPKALPMVPVQFPDGNPCDPGIERLRQMVMVRAFPGIDAAAYAPFVPHIFDVPDTLDRLCTVSGGHVRSLLVLLYSCLQQEDPPIPRDVLENVILQRRHQLLLAIESEEWGLLRHVAQTKKLSGLTEYQTLLRSLWVFEYRYQKDYWFDINPVLAEAPELEN